MNDSQEKLRERKRRETLRRIADVSLQLFITRGFEQTTLDDIAEHAKISRRSFFNYYKSKEDILYVWLGDGLAGAIKPALLEEAVQDSPLETVRSALLKLVGRLETKESLAIDRLLQSTELLKSRKQALFIEMENSVVDALIVMYPSKRKAAHVRTVAMVSIGALRMALNRWRDENAKRRVSHYLNIEFDELKKLE